MGNRLTLLKHIERRSPSGKKMALFACSCGNTVEAVVSSIISGNTGSCGCIKHELLMRRNTKHGGCGTQTYRAYKSMKHRCYNKNYAQFKDYGGRGIKVCDRWLNSYSNFLSDMGPRPKGLSLDRIDNDGDYSPENCRWATRTEQNNNTRKNVKLEAAGIKMSAAEWANSLEVPVSRIYYRIKAGWSDHDALFTPKGVRPKTI